MSRLGPSSPEITLCRLSPLSRRNRISWTKVARTPRSSPHHGNIKHIPLWGRIEIFRKKAHLPYSPMIWRDSANLAPWLMPIIRQGVDQTPYWWDVQSIWYYRLIINLEQRPRIWERSNLTLSWCRHLAWIKGWLLWHLKWWGILAMVNRKMSIEV